jgi:hypothetical protein
MAGMGILPTALSHGISSETPRTFVIAIADSVPNIYR